MITNNNLLFQPGEASRSRERGHNPESEAEDLWGGGKDFFGLGGRGGKVAFYNITYHHTYVDSITITTLYFVIDSWNERQLGKMFRPMTSPRFRLVIVEILSLQWQWKWWWVQRWLWRRWWWWSLVISTQEELAASKLREAESNLALKDLRSKVSDFDFEKKNMMIVMVMSILMSPTQVTELNSMWQKHLKKGEAPPTPEVDCHLYFW